MMFRGATDCWGWWSCPTRSCRSRCRSSSCPCSTPPWSPARWPAASIILVFAALFTLGQGLICCFGLLLTRSSLRHLLVVPLFRIISEPLRVYLLYKSLFAALKGREHGWNKLHDRHRRVRRRADGSRSSRVVWAPPLPAATEGAAVPAASSTPARPYPRLAPIPWTHQPVGVAIK